MNHSPAYYADKAEQAEKEERWDDAARLWDEARYVSIGHNRRFRYEQRADYCRRMANK